MYFKYKSELLILLSSLINKYLGIHVLETFSNFICMHYIIP